MWENSDRFNEFLNSLGKQPAEPETDSSPTIDDLLNFAEALKMGHRTDEHRKGIMPGKINMRGFAYRITCAVMIIGFLTISSYIFHQSYVPVLTDVLVAFFITGALVYIVVLVRS